MKVSVLLAGAVAACALSTAPVSLHAARPKVCAECVKANMERLAGEDLHGRGCGTDDEHAAAQFIVSTMKHAKIAPAFAGGAYLQPVELVTPVAASPATLELTGGGHVSLLHGRDMVALEPPEHLTAPFVLVSDGRAGPDTVKGKVVIYDSLAFDTAGIQNLLRAGAAAVISPASDQILQRWDQLAARPPGPIAVAGVAPRPGPTRGATIFVRPEAMAALKGLTGGEARLEAPRGAPRTRTTYDVMGVLHGRGPDADRQAVLLTAHYDHLGVRGGVTFHGANDDASGTAAVLEFARILGGQGRHRRTVYFGLFGCEEEGELGAQFIQAHPPMVITDLIANLEFEMIGVDDPKRPGALMLTGWDRTNLGPALQAHGAKVGPDLYPEQNFFQRSDNYQLALKGVVAQTVSAWPVPPTYHAATDDLAHVDLAFMDSVIGSMIAPVTWLLDSDFQPEWLPGKKP